MIQTFIENYGNLIRCFSIFSTICFFASLLIIPWIICKLEEDFFLRSHEPPYSCVILRYFLGFVLLLAGILMLFLPGQGIITVILGLSLLEFPGKQRAVEGLLAIHSLRTSLNWIRRKGKRSDFRFKVSL